MALKILIAEDVVATQQLLKKFLTQQGHTVLIADNGQQAIEVYQQHQPDIILCDINMPIMNGLEAIKEIRQLTHDAWIPILILSASDQDRDIITGLEAGADDYLPKPINLKVLNAKVGAMQRFVALQKTNIANKQTLQHLHDEYEQEQLLAKNIASTMLDRGNLNLPNIQYWLQPNRHFSGDLIAVSQATSGNKLFVLLADSTGHGLAAALPVLTVSRTFHAMTAKNFSISELATEINTSIKAILTPDRFIASNIFAIDFETKTIEAWCGGNPDSLLVNEAGDIVHRFKSRHLAIGILPTTAFDSSTEIWQWDSPTELITYSDGITDATNVDGEFFGEQRLLNVLEKTPAKQRINQLKQAVLTHLNTEQGDDDISLLSVYCD